MANRYFQQFLYSFTKKLTSIHGLISVVQAVKATVTAQGITYTADAFGSAGNSITVTLVGGGTAGAEVVTVDGTDITVEIESGVSTRTQVKTALDASVDAAALIDVSVVSGATAVNAAAAVTLAGGVDGVSSDSVKGASVARTGVGQYTVTFEDQYSALMACNLTVEAATPVDLVPQILSYSLANKQIVFSLLAGATPTEVAAPLTVHFHALFRNSSVAN